MEQDVIMATGRRWERLLAAGRDVLPSFSRPDTWLTAVRVLLSFLLPLTFGAVAGSFERTFPMALASGMIALVDPRGSTERRGVTMLTAIFGGMVMLFVGSLVSDSLIGTLLLACALGFLFGLMCEFGTAGVRCTFFLASTGFMGAGSSASGSALSPLDILLGGTLPLILAFMIFPRGIWQRKRLGTRILDFTDRAVDHLLMRTPIGRHAYRTMVAVGLSVTVSVLLGSSQTVWAAMTVLAMFYPTSPVIYKRGATYFLSTAIAVIAAFAVITLVQNIYYQAVIVAIGLFATAAARSADYAAFSFTNALFYILVTMLVTGVGGPDLLFERLRGVALGVIIALVIGMFTLPARERLALLASMGLPLPAYEKIDDPVLARIRLEQVIKRIYYATKLDRSELSVDEERERIRKISKDS